MNILMLSPKNYDAVVTLLGSFFGGLIVFCLGLLVGWLFWRTKRDEALDEANRESRSRLVE